MRPWSRLLRIPGGSLARRSGAVAAALLLVLTGCNRPAPEPLFHDEIPIVPGVQAERIEQNLASLAAKTGISLAIRVRIGEPPAPPPPGTKEAKKAAARIRQWQADVYALAGAVRLARPPEARPEELPPPEWEEAFQARLAGVYNEPARVGDAIEVSLRELLEKEKIEPALSAAAAADAAAAREEHDSLRKAARTEYAWPRARPQARGDDPGPQKGAEEAYLAYLVVAGRRAARPGLSLYTPESRKFLQENPLTAKDLARVERKYVGARYTIAELGGRAVVYFPKEDAAFPPVFLAKDAEGWRVDLYTAAHILRVDPQGRWNLVERDHPYMFAFAPYRVDETGYVNFKGN